MIELPSPLNIDATEREAAVYAQSLAMACQPIFSKRSGADLFDPLEISHHWLWMMDWDTVVDVEAAQRAKILWQSVEDWKVAEKARNPRYALRELMSDMSEEAECASWQSGTEFLLWRVMVAGEPTQWSRLKLDTGKLAELRSLHEAAGGWWRWNDDIDGGWGDLEFLPTDEWVKVAAAGMPVPEAKAVVDGKLLKGDEAVEAIVHLLKGKSDD